MAINATFNNISYSVEVSFVGGNRSIPGENHRPVASHWQTKTHKVVSSTPGLRGLRIHNFSSDRHSTTYGITTTLFLS